MSTARFPDPRPDDHPSYLALDRAAMGAPSPDTVRHVERCERCRSHVGTVGTPANDAPIVDLRLRRETAVRASRPRPVVRRALTVTGAVALAAAAILFFVTARQARHQRRAPDRAVEIAAAEPDTAGYDTVKGGRAVGVYIRRGGSTFLWNGSESIVPGDTLRLKVVPDGLGSVHVFSEAPGPGGARDLVLLHRASLPPDRDSLLPAAWSVDDAGYREVLVVVLSRAAIDLEAARAAARAGGQGQETWVSRLSLPKGHATETAP